jgi:hypothetical protein
MDDVALADYVAGCFGGPVEAGRVDRRCAGLLPAGARFQLDQLVSLQTEGDSHSEVIRAMVIAQLKIMRREYDLKLPTAANSPSTDAKPAE